MSDNLNTKQRQCIYDTIVNYKETYASIGTVANAMLAMLCAIGPEGIHIKSLEGMHKAAPRTKGNPFSGTLNYMRTINKVLREEIGPRAPQLVADIVGNQRVCWKLATEESTETET